MNEESKTPLECSCRLPLLVLFISAAVWLVIGSVFALVSSLKFHAPGLLADSAWLGYGRVRPAYLNAIVYGFCVQAGLGVALWLLVRLGQTPLAQRWVATLGAATWNLGVTVGVLGILAGDSTGFEYLEMPGYAAVLVFAGYLLVGLAAVSAFHQRQERRLYVSQWFLLAAIFWFPWIYSTANLLLLTFPARGVEQAIIDWWFANNLLHVWVALVGLGVVFYFIPRLANRDLNSHYLALLTFWLLILVAPWAGIPNTAPVPAWMPAISTPATVLLVVPLIAVALNLYSTLGRFAVASRDNPSLSFVLLGLAGFLAAGLLRIPAPLLDPTQQLYFTWFESGRSLLQLFGFFSLVIFGAAYCLLPQLVALTWPWPKLVRAHFWVAAIGVLLLVLPLLAGGLVQALKLREPSVSAVEISKATLPFLRVSTMGDLLLLVGHVLFLCNLVGLAVRFYRARAEAAYASATADLFKVAEAKA